MTPGVGYSSCRTQEHLNEKPSHPRNVHRRSEICGHNFLLMFLWTSCGLVLVLGRLGTMDALVAKIPHRDLAQVNKVVMDAQSCSLH